MPRFVSQYKIIKLNGIEAFYGQIKAKDRSKFPKYFKNFDKILLLIMRGLIKFGIIMM